MWDRAVAEKQVPRLRISRTRNAALGMTWVGYSTARLKQCPSRAWLRPQKKQVPRLRIFAYAKCCARNDMGEGFASLRLKECRYSAMAVAWHCVLGLRLYPV